MIEDECVESGLCRRADICPTDAIYHQELAWPRIVRQEFSNTEYAIQAWISPRTGNGRDEDQRCFLFPSCRRLDAMGAHFFS